MKLKIASVSPVPITFKSFAIFFPDHTENNPEQKNCSWSVSYAKQA
jgi:hypothetical protein